MSYIFILTLIAWPVSVPYFVCPINDINGGGGGQAQSGERIVSHGLLGRAEFSHLFGTDAVRIVGTLKCM